MKKCKICEELKLLSDYYSQKIKSKSRGEYVYYNPECKECTKNKSRQWQLDNPKKRKRILDKYNVSEKGRQHFYKNNKIYRSSGRYGEWQTNNKDKIKEYREKRNKSKKHDISNKEWNVCLEFFGYCCSYCGISEELHKNKHGQRLHKEHVIHNGRNDIKNCIPSCKSCNGSKHLKTLNEWYNESNANYTRERYLRIYQWVRYECKNL